MKIVMTGGGTGGHIYPALAIADKFMEMDPENEVLYIGDGNCMESTIVPDHGYDFRPIPAEEVNRSNPLKLAKTAVKNIAGIAEARRIMQGFRPDIVIGTGGFVSFPVIFAGQSLGARCYFHEQNAFPGLANRMLEKYASKVFLGFGSASGFFKQPEKHVVTGNPVRKAFFEADKIEARGKLGISQQAFVILSFGGSLGAGRINDVMYDVMKQLNGEEKNGRKIILLFGTGKIYYDRIMERVKEDGLEIAPNIVIKPYIDDMVSYLSAADLVISRSGALTCAEVCACGRASVLIPSPNVTGNHQYYNAKEVADAGGAVLIEEKDFTFDRMMELIVRFLNEPEELKEMSRKAAAFAGQDAAQTIYDEIMKDLMDKQ
ncbi:MAG: undecaprenyldiphospho-muramoylpentapeptide beta-N-acetylglucosaminyltransferase [Eubacterium sp.]|nr:undecaprenyldiphospho-muramoylpentapeptide beta-N-acetylglucosaminyltransferase [Eubacterium sp.]